MNQDTQDVSGPLPPQQRGLLAWLFGALHNPLRRRRLASSIGRYRVVRKIGEGGMGTVFEAVDEGLGRRVAIKRLKAVDASGRRRFSREARAAARLTHPNVCQVYEVGEDSAGPFLVMELLSGEPLSTRLKRQSMNAEEIIPLGAGMLAALSAIHAAGFVHRDLKPSNVYLTPYGPRLLDFGLVRHVPSDVVREMPSHIATPDPISGTPLTDGRNLIGTPGYMAPEQIRGSDVDTRADLFAAGVVLYEALAGHRAFRGTNAVEVLSATLEEAPDPLPAPLTRLDSFLRHALAKKPAERFATAQEMAEALHAASAAPAAGARGRIETENGEIFVGRTPELAWLEERLGAAMAGAGGVVFVTGERGAGKSALVGEMLRRVRAASAPITVVAGRCLEHQGPRDPLQPFLDALGRLFGTTRGREKAVELVKTWAPTVGVLMPAALVPDPDGTLHRQTAGATRERLIRESGDFMEAATRIYPVVLLIEDLQWADPVSVEVLCHLGRRAARQRFLILGTCRSSEVEETNLPLHRGMLDLTTAGQGRELALGPLHAPDVEQWLERRFPGNDFAPTLAPLLHARAEGLPLFVRSLFELLAGRRDIEPRPGGFQLARPLDALDLEPSKGVKDLVRAHLATLPAAERELLAAASVLGKEFSSAIARGLASGNELELEERMQRLCRVSRVLESRGEEDLPDGTLGSRYRFAHGLYQRVLYEDLVAPRRAELHRRAGDLLLRHWGENAPSRAVEMAEHFERGRDFTRAVRLQTRAGELAVRRYAGAEALEHYTRALGLLSKLPASEAKPLDVALLGRRASAHLLRARFDEAALELQGMLQRARAARLPAAECEALSALCYAHFFEQRLPEMKARAKEALQAAKRLGAPHQLAEARSRAALVFVVEGRLDAAGKALDEAITASRDSGSRYVLEVCLGQRGFVHYWQCEFAAAEATLAESLVLSEENGDGFEAFLARMFVGLARTNQGRMSEGLAEFEHAAVLARRNGDRFWEPRLVSHQGYVHRELGSFEKARAFDTSALAIARENPSPWSPEVDALLNLCIDGARTSDAGAEGYIAALEHGVRGNGWLRWMNELRLEAVAAEHFVATGSLQVGLERAERLTRIARELRAHGYACTAARVQAEAALASGRDLSEKAAVLARALEALASRPAPLETWKSRRVLGLLRRRLGDEAGAQGAFASAADDIETIVAGTDQAALRECFIASPAVREVFTQAGRA